MQQVESQTNKTIKGVSWSFIDTMANQGITFLVGLVLARLLSPSEYGLIGIVTIFIAVFNSIVDSGFSNALIRKTDTTAVDLSTCFIANMAISIFLFVLMFIAAPWVAIFFKEPQLVALMRAMGVILIINALSLVQRTILVKKVDFKTQAKVSLISSVVSGAIGIWMAYKGCGVWSLVGQQISRQTLNALFLWIFNRWMPKLVFSVDSFKGLWSFGWKLMASSLVSTLYKEIHQVVIGKCYSPATLGLYTRSKQFSEICSGNLTSIIQRVTYPVLSNIQDNKERLKAGYQRVIRTTVFPTFVLMFGMMACAKPMILVLLGEQWIDCALMLQIICTYGMLAPLHAINLNMLQVQGRSDLFLKLEIIKDIIALIPIVFGIFVSIYAMLIATFFSNVTAYYLNAYYSGPFIGYSFWDQLNDIKPSLLISLSMAIPVYAMSFIPISPFILLPIQICVGGLIVYIICEKVRTQEYLEIKGIIVKAIKKVL